MHAGRAATPIPSGSHVWWRHTSSSHSPKAKSSAATGRPRRSAQCSRIVRASPCPGIRPKLTRAHRRSERCALGADRLRAPLGDGAGHVPRAEARVLLLRRHQRHAAAHVECGPGAVDGCESRVRSRAPAPAATSQRAQGRIPCLEWRKLRRRRSICAPTETARTWRGQCRPRHAAIEGALEQASPQVPARHHEQEATVCTRRARHKIEAAQTESRSSKLDP